jgi:hypothetical protein
MKSLLLRLVFCCLLCALPPAALAITRYVSASGPGGDGLSWATASTNLAVALEAAAAGDSVWVAGGEYAGNLRIPPGVTVLAGFRGDEAEPETRNSRRNATRIRLATNGVPTITFLPGSGMATLDGFRLEGLRGPGSVITATNALLGLHDIDLIAPGLTVDVFSQSGRPLWNLQNCDVRITGCNLIAATAGDRALIELRGEGFIVGNYFAANFAESELSGIASGLILLNEASPLIERNWFAGNYGNRGGGITALGSSAPLIRNNIFTEQQAYLASLGENDRRDGGSALFGDTNASPRFVHNTVVTRGGAPLRLLGTNGLVANNLFVFGDAGAQVAGLEPISNNGWVGITNTYGTNSVPITGVSGNIALEYPFVSEANRGHVMLRTNSPAIDSGIPLADAGDVDFFGNPRVLGSSPDLGAFESDGQTPVLPSPAVIHVSSSGDDSNSGLTWATAKRTVSSAIEEAARSGGEVWVAAGSYQEETLRFGYLVSLYGGFSGSETERNERNPRLNPTVLDGGGTNQILVQVSSALTASGYRPLQTIDGFVFRNGFSSSAGGAISAISVQIQNNRFESNRVYGPLSRGIYGPFAGGGAVVTTGLSALLSGNTFIANSVVLTNAPGAGLLAQGAGGAVLIGGGDAVIRDNLFHGNWNEVRSASAAPPSGSAIGVSTVSGLTNTYVENNTFIDNFSIRTNSSPISSQITPPASVLAIGTASGGVSGRARIVLQNNLFAFNDGVIARDRSATTNLVTAYNCVFRNASDSIPAGVSNLFVNPGFAGVGAYPRLAADSPLRDAGRPETLIDGRTDVDGRPRRIGAGVDIGAYEFDPQDAVTAVPLVYVRPDGDDAADGRAWATAKKTIQSAVASLDISGGEIRVRGGEYSGPIQLGEFVSLYGGFAGSETRREERNWAANPTVIVPGPGSETPAGPLVEMRSRSEAGVISGFHIRNGVGPSAGGVVVRGGGLVSENRFVGNRGTNGFQLFSSPTITAGALLVLGPGTLRVENNLFMSNSISARQNPSPGSPVIASDSLGRVKLINNTLYRNSPGFARRLLYFESTNNVAANNVFLGDPDNITGPAVPIIESSSNLVSRGAILGLEPSGYIVADPGLVNPAAGDFTPSGTSPARDAADPRYAPFEARDLAGRLRGEGGRNDIGAFEYYPPPVADFGVDITSPTAASSQVAGQPLDVTFSLTDSSRVLVNAVLLVNGQAVATNAGNIRVVRWTIPQIGTNTLTVRAEAAGFQPAVSAPVEIVFSVPDGDAPPVIRLVSTTPAGSQLFAPVQFGLNANVTDGASGVPARWEWRTAAGDLLRAGSGGVGPTSVEAARAGDYTFVLRVWDRVGQTATTNYTVSVASANRWVAGLGDRFRPQAINDAGLVCGRLYIEGGWDYPAFLDEGLITPLSVGSRTTATINAINVGGSAVGRFGIYPSRFRKTEVVRLTDGDGMAYGINTADVIVGVLNIEGGVTVPTIWSNGVAASLPLGDACCGVARGINDAGWIVGHITDTNGVSKAALWRSNRVEMLATDGAAGAAYAINNSGLIVGQVNGLPAQWRDGALEYLPAGGEGIATTVNLDGAIGGTVNSRPVIWVDGLLREVTEGISGISRARVASGTVVSLNSGLDMVIDNGTESVLIRRNTNVPAPRLVVDPLLLPVSFRIGAGLGFTEASLVIEASTDLRSWSPVATNALDLQIPVDSGFRFFRASRRGH